MTGVLRDLTFTGDGKQNITVTVSEDFREEFDALKDKPITIEIRRAYKHRSLDANAYCWVLCGEIARKMNSTKNEVYRHAVRESGVYTIHCLPDSMLEQAVNDWESFGLGFQVETFESKTKGCTNAIFYKGSSYYDSKQMARLIDGLVQDAESLGIPTITPAEAARLAEQWGKK